MGGGESAPPPEGASPLPFLLSRGPAGSRTLLASPRLRLNTGGCPTHPTFLRSLEDQRAAGKAPAGAVVATDRVSTNADYDNGGCDLCGTRGSRRGDMPATLPMTQGVSKKGEAGPHVACSVAAPLPFSRAQLTHQNFRKWGSSLFDRGHRSAPLAILAVRTTRIVVVADHRRAVHVPSHLVFPGHTTHLGQS
jgi:hypothetical protein